MPTRQSVEHVVARHFQAARRMDVEAWVSTFEPDGERFDPGQPVPACGHHALRRFFQGILRSFEHFDLVEDAVYVLGDLAAVTWTLQATAPDGRGFRSAGVDVIEVSEDAKIRRTRSFWEPDKLAAQLM